MAIAAADTAGRGPLGRFLAWWGGELSALLPRGLLAWAIGAPRFPRIEIAWPPDPADIADKIGTRRNRPTEALLPAEAALRRRLRLPKTAAGEIDQIVELELSRALPFDRAEFEWRRGEAIPEAGGLALDVYIIRRADLSELDTLFDRAGARFAGVRIMADGATIGPFGGESAMRTSRLSAWRWPTLALAAVCLAMIVHAVATPHLARLERIEAMERQLARLNAEAVALRGEVNALEAEAARADNFASSAAARVKVVDILLEATRRLPDEAFLTSLAIDSGRVRLKGEVAGSAADLALSLGASALLTSPALAGTTRRRDGSGAESFELSAAIGAPE